MADGGSNSITDLVEYATQADFDKPDLAVALEIADRANQSKKDCKELVTALIKVMKKSHKQVVLNAILLIDTLTKNCDMRFHYEIARKDFCEALLKLLKRRRQKAGFLSKVLSSNDDRIEEIEEKVLYLIQLWADTFMMHEDEFKPVQEAYRLLRKEGVKFPPRDPNEKFMIKFKGTVSPVFESGELTQNPDNASTNNTSGKAQSASEKSKSTLSKPAVSNANKKSTNQQGKKKPDESDDSYDSKEEDNEDEDEDDSELEELGNAHVTYQEMKSIKNTVSVLNEIMDNATDYQNMRTKAAREVLNDLVRIQKRIALIIQFENFKDDLERMNCLDLNDAINDSVSAYHERYVQLKNKAKNEDNPVGFSDVKAIESAKGKTKEKDEQKGKKIAHSTSKTEGKPGKLAPPTGWNDPNPEKKQLAQNFINLLDLDDEEERQGNQVKQLQQQPQQVQKENQIPKPSETFVSKPKTNGKEQTGQPTIIAGAMNVQKNVDLLDLDLQNDNKTAENVQTGTFGGIKAQNLNPSNTKPITSASEQQQAKPIQTEDEDDDFFSSIANRKKEV